MGVTIHFEGKLKSQDSYLYVIDIAKQFAISNDLEFTIFEEGNKLLQRVKNEEDCDYQGPTKGIVIEIATNCDPLNLEFDEALYIQEYCKTQFTRTDNHIIIINLLRTIEPYFNALKIHDEGEYWETEDITILQMHIDNCFRGIEEAKEENSSLEGPFRVDGRIIDLMS